MRGLLFSFLAVGLTGVFAAPAANAAADTELEARATCTITCQPGYFAEYNSKTKKCKCVKVNEEICLRETICIGTHYASWDATTQTCSCQPYDFSAEEKCLREQICIGTQHAVWNSTTKKCTCELYVFEDPDAETICKTATDCIAGSVPVWHSDTKKCTCDPVSDPEKDRCLLATTCLTGSHAFWNPSTRKCSCNPNNGEFICKAATTCSRGSVPVWHPLTETCTCGAITKRQDASTEESPDPTTCPTIRCAAGTLPKWIPSTQKCVCSLEPIPVSTTKSVKTTTTKSAKPTTTTKSAKPTTTNKSVKPITTTTSTQPYQSPLPGTCPTIKCAAGYKPVYDPKTKTCSCQPDPTQCLDWVCIAEKRPVWDPVTGRCGCQWIPGLEPVPVNPCTDIWCIAEMTPKVNTTTGLCECEWIPGLEPGAPTDAKRNTIDERAPEPEAMAEAEPQLFHPTCRGIYCIAEQHPVYNATSKRCECEWIPGLGPVTVKERVALPAPTSVNPITKTTSSSIASPTDPLNCYFLKIYCEGGDHHMHYNPKTKQCECPPVKLTRTRTPVPVPTAPPPVNLGCENLLVYCEFGDHVMHYDETCKCCKCPAK